MGSAPKSRMIGVVGGVGPHAGLDLARKIFDQTRAGSDQEHLPVALLSRPEEIADRTEFLLGRVKNNPADAIFRIIRELEGLGAGVVGVPCNTSHAPRIFDAIRRKLAAAGSAVTLVHMIEEVARFLREHFPSLRRLGLLATTGTCKAGAYAEILEPHGCRVLLPDERLQEEAVHRAIYDPHFGIKAQPNPVAEAARKLLDEVIRYLQGQGAEAIILGCTELPLAVTEKRIGQTIIIDPNLILARALIREAAPEKLKPFQP
ncbi:MAG: aspartate racemase [Planctomycetes bacterium SM23_25]|nr:MAG: aspartate racemase [Planctomycetes bacterium SM23_25]